MILHAGVVNIDYYITFGELEGYVRDEDGVGYSFNEWDVETVASANVFIFSGLPCETALFEAAWKRNRALCRIEAKQLGSAKPL